MSGLRERKRRKTFTAIHEAAMELFSQRGYNAVTVADIAAAAEVSRATVFAYYPAKENIVFGEAPLAIEGLAALLADAEDQAAVVARVHGWLKTLAGWVEPDLVLQMRLADEVPAVSAARSSVLRDVEAVIAEALARVMDDEPPLVARLVAGSLTAALAAFEHEAAVRMAGTGHPLAPDEVDALLGAAVAFVDGGLARLAQHSG